MRNSSKQQNTPCTEIKSQNKTAKVQQQERKEQKQATKTPKYQNKGSTNTKAKMYNSKQRKNQMQNNKRRQKINCSKSTAAQYQTPNITAEKTKQKLQQHIRNTIPTAPNTKHYSSNDKKSR